MSEYVLLYRSTPEAHDEAMGTPERARRSMDKWRAWFREMAEKGQLKSIGLPLERTGKVLSGKRKTVVDGPYAESKEVLGGFSIVEAKDSAEAARIAADCPILERGGSVEVRPVLALEA
ncbi:MAG TPA: YciI family protein [Usitatibacter sp.]|nr:YciI family protein [Usitatibacter sp.]